MQGPDLVCDLEQLEYQYRLTTSGEEEIIYCPPDMTEKPCGLQIK